MKIDVNQAVVNKLKYSGTMLATDCPRLIDDLNGKTPAENATQLQWEAEFKTEKKPVQMSRHRLDLSIRGYVEQTCQRCLHPIQLPIDEQRVFFLTQSPQEYEKEARLLDDSIEDDPELELQPFDFNTDWLLVESVLDLQALIEEEVLLSLPIIPKHADCSISTTMDASSGEDSLTIGQTHQPFAKLSELIKKS